MLDYAAALARPPVRAQQVYTARDTILYALGVGLGRDPVDRRDLRFLYEDGLVALPTMGVVLAPGSIRDLDLGIDLTRMLHGEQHLRLHRPIPAAGAVVGELRVVDVIDRGADKGAVVRAVKEITDAVSGEPITSSTITVVCRGDGGFGGPSRPTPPAHPIPDRAPDHVCTLPGDRRSALIYRLSGDYNPLHIDPDVAARAGFERPILHGLCTFGMVGHAVLKTLFDSDPARLTEIGGRFTSPVMPGETLQVEIWDDEDEVSLRAKVLERDAVVFNNGRAVGVR
jgi:acyl dehydratase